MKTIKFNKNEYNLIDLVIESASTIRITILKDKYNIIELTENVNAEQSFQVLEDGEVVKIFNGYSELTGIQLFNNYPIANELTAPAFSFTLENVSIQSQLDSIRSNITEIENTYSNTISEFNTTLNNLVNAQNLQDMAIEEIGEALSELEPNNV